MNTKKQHIITVKGHVFKTSFVNGSTAISPVTYIKTNLNKIKVAFSSKRTIASSLYRWDVFYCILRKRPVQQATIEPGPLSRSRAMNDKHHTDGQSADNTDFSHKM